MNARASHSGRVEPPSRVGSIVLSLFALPFAAIGVVCGFTFVSHWSSEGWTESTLVRAILAVTFGGVGFGLLALVPWLRRRQLAEHTLKQRAPDQPWLWRPEWARGRIPCQGGAGVAFVWAFAAVWNLISAPLAWKIPEEWARGNHAAAIGLLFPVVGLGLLFWAVRASLRWRRFGRSVLELSTRPGVVGGKLAGLVQLSKRLGTDHGFEARLACVHVRHTGSGKNRSRHEDVLWEDVRAVAGHALLMGPTGTAVPVAFTIPRRLDPSSPESGDSFIEWRLDLTAELPGVDYFARFEVPVFVTPDSSEDVTDEAVREERGVEAATPARPVDSAHGAAFRADSRIRVRRGAGGVVFDFPARRNLGGAVGVTVFAAVWTAIVWFLTTLGWGGWIMAAVFGFFDLLILWAAIRMWFHSATVVAGPGGLALRSSVLGIGSVTDVTPEELVTVAAEVKGRSGSRSVYSLLVHRAGRPKPLDVADQLSDAHEAEWLAAEMWKAVKGDAPRPDPPARRKQGRKRGRVEMGKARAG